ncbi:hypothetical protein Xmir_04423 [Xenorhabdus miraniensis]|uniref:Tail fibre protein gp37 trimerization region domain-containing protein n=1 Tax=Xenorhabdus miraniensis TaxID=351674 RepID=A0A2D0J762_9GAMM|nr:hypothetical protein Xmir_04423 [Xenorhabdus miraniensis]
MELAKNAIPASAITQYSGNSPSHVMSQNTVTKSLNDKLDKTGGQITTNDQFLVLKNQSDGAANYIEAADANGNIRYRLGCMSSDSALQLVNVAGKTTLSIKNSAIYVNGFKLATEDRMDKNYVSKIRLIFSREIEIDRGIFPALKPGEVVTGVRGSTRDLYYEARNLRLHVIQYLVNNEWVTANA